MANGVAGAIEAMGCRLFSHTRSDALREQLRDGELSPQSFYQQVLKQFYGLVFEALAAQRELPVMQIETRVGDNEMRWNDIALCDAQDSVHDAVLEFATRTAQDSRQLGLTYEKLLDLEPKIDFDSHLFSLQQVTQSERKISGTFYTPDALVQHLLDTTLEPVVASCLDVITTSKEREIALLDIKICDPAVGSGHFLIAAAHRLASHLADIRSGDDEDATSMYQTALCDVIQHCIYGVDIDPMAVELCRMQLWLNVSNPTDVFCFLNNHIQCANALFSIPPNVPAERRVELEQQHGCHSIFDWRGSFPKIFTENNGTHGFNVVLGNPPFLNQLASATTIPKHLDGIIKCWSNGAVRNFTDSSALFLLLAMHIAAPGGRVALVLPQSFLATRDARGVRTEILKTASLESLWISNEHVFGDAAVFTCAPSLHLNGLRRATLHRFATGQFTKLPSMELDNDALLQEETWSHLTGASSGIPVVAITSSRTIADIAHATADFRDQYYGLDGFLVEDSDLTDAQRTDASAFPPIITSGLIDLVQCHWGVATTRILKTTWRAPRIDRQLMEAKGALGPWLDARLVPKIVLATQTRIIELIVDTDARYVPSTPLITITPKNPSDLWRIAAALASPVCTALAMQKYAGAAMNINAIKLSAKQVLLMPIPEATNQAHCAAWDAAANVLRAAQDVRTPNDRLDHLVRFAELSCRAFDVPDPDSAQLLSWWSNRLRRALPK